MITIAICYPFCNNSATEFKSKMEHSLMKQSRSLKLLGLAISLALAAPAAQAVTGMPTSPKGESTAESGGENGDGPPKIASDTDTLPAVEVVGTEDHLSKIPGSAVVIPEQELEAAHVFTTSEALRKVPGVHVRDEEGLGLRPNIGMRGLNPTRSTKTNLLEDGLPLSFAPYGDNASYYHPPIERFDRFEVMKGSSQNLFGPRTIGGLINYITPDPPEDFQGRVRATGGSRDYFNGYLSVGGYRGLLDVMYKQGDGARDNTHSELHDLYGKKVFELSENQSLILRGSYYSEESQNTYSGLTDAEYARLDNRYNPFKNDYLDFEHWGLSATHRIDFSDDVRLTTSAYGTIFERDWWRQASSTTTNHCSNTGGNSAAVNTTRTRGTVLDVDGGSCNGIQGNLRDYYTYGFETRLFDRYNVLGLENELETGVRAHYEIQRREQRRGTRLTAADNTPRTEEQRYTDAYSAFLQNRVLLGDWAVIPNVRVEHFIHDGRNETNGNRGEETTTAVLPGFGLTYTPVENSTLFFSMHRGYAPPGVTDLLNTSATNPDQITTNVDEEKSWNYELGVRSKPIPGAMLEVTGFHNDFENLISTGSIAGGSLPLAQSEAKFEGLEILGRLDSDELFHTSGDAYLQIAYTWLPTAEITSPVTRVDTGAVLQDSEAGNRLPYAPENMLTTTVGYKHTTGWDVRLEAVHVGQQWADFANTRTPDGTGQFGLIDSYTILNLAGTYPIKSIDTDLFVTVKNLGGKEYVVDRTRGILPGTPLLVQGGFEVRF
jgi:Fe(3+) dicitrate transport protein